MVAKRRWEVFSPGNQGEADYTVSEGPGPLASAALFDPTRPLTMHPFASLSSRSPFYEGTIARLLSAATDIDDFIGLLADAGFEVGSAADGGTVEPPAYPSSPRRGGPCGQQWAVRRGTSAPVRGT